MYRRTKLPRSALLATLRMVRKLVPALLLSLCAAPVAAEPVTIQGSTTFNATLIDPYRLTIERRAGVRLDVVPSKSIHGLVALLEGRARIAMISTSLEPEVALLRTRRPELPVDRLRGFEISRTRVAFVAHPSASVRALNREQLRRLLLGEITRWSELGGADIPVTIVTVQAGGGVPSTVRDRLLGGAQFAAPAMVVVEAPSHVLKVTRQLVGALGITQRRLAPVPGVVELPLDSPIEQELNLVTLGDPSPDLTSVIEAVRSVAAEHLL